MEISRIHGLLQWSHVNLQELEPHGLQSHLIRVDVSCGHCLITSLQTLVAIGSIRPLAERLHYRNHILAERNSGNGESVDIRTGLIKGDIGSKQFLVVRMDVPLLPVQGIRKELVKVGLGQFHVERVWVDEMTPVEFIGHVHKDVLGAQVMAQRHIRIHGLVHELHVWQDVLLSQVGGGHKGYIPDATEE